MLPESLKQLKVLYVEDEVLIALDGEEMVRGMGFVNVSVALSYEDAHRAITRENFDLALLDINLGGGRTSLSLAESLREKGVRILFFSGYSATDELETRLGAPIISKPFDEKTLHHAITEMLSLREPHDST